MKKILVLEDSRELQLLLQAILVGYQVECASSGAEAMAHLLAAPTLPDLILLDIGLPDMTGMEFRQQQEQTPRLGRIPVIVMTTGEYIESTAMLVGAKAFLRKPFTDLGLVQATVKRFCSE